MILVVYFHGFASSPDTSKVAQLKAAGFKVVAPSINIDPDIAEHELTLFIKNELHKDFGQREPSDPIIFVGTSLGGFWAARMAEKFDCPSVLINPAMHPEVSLQQYIGDNESYKDGKSFHLSKETVQKYKKYSNFTSDSHRTYFVAKNDDIVKDVKRSLGPSAFHEFDSDDHRGLTMFPKVIEHLKSLKSADVRK